MCGLLSAFTSCFGWFTYTRKISITWPANSCYYKLPLSLLFFFIKLNVNALTLNIIAYRHQSEHVRSEDGLHGSPPVAPLQRPGIEWFLCTGTGLRCNTTLTPPPRDCWHRAGTYRAVSIEEVNWHLTAQLTPLCYLPINLLPPPAGQLRKSVTTPPNTVFRCQPSAYQTAIVPEHSEFEKCDSKESLHRTLKFNQSLFHKCLRNHK